MSTETDSDRQQDHWLHRFTPSEWIRAGLGELGRAEAAFASKNVAAGIVGAKRAAGMTLNAALIVEPNDAWGRTYVEHLEALAASDDVPSDVGAAARLLRDAEPPSGPIVMLRTGREHEELIEAAKTVMAHAYAVAHGRQARAPREVEA